MCQVVSTCKKLWVFDFDDTLVKTDSKTFLVEPDGTRIALTPHEYATRVWRPEEQYVFDYDEFLRLINPRPISHYVSLLHEARRTCGGTRVHVLSARSTSDPIKEFLRSIGAHDVGAHGAASSNPAVKAAWVRRRLAHGDVDELEFFDDAVGNVEAIRSLQGEHPHVRITVHLVPR